MQTLSAGLRQTLTMFLLLPEKQSGTLYDLVTESTITEVTCQSPVKARIIQVGKGRQPAGTQPIGNLIVIYILGHLFGNLGAHASLSQFSLYQPLAFGPEGQAVVLPEPGKSKVVGQVLLSEFGGCCVYYVFGETMFAKPLSDFAFAAGAVAEIAIGFVEAIL